MTYGFRAANYIKQILTGNDENNNKIGATWVRISNDGGITWSKWDYLLNYNSLYYRKGDIARVVTNYMIVPGYITGGRTDLKLIVPLEKMVPTTLATRTELQLISFNVVARSVNGNYILREQELVGNENIDQNGFDLWLVFNTAGGYQDRKYVELHIRKADGTAWTHEDGSAITNNTPVIFDVIDLQIGLNQNGIDLE